MFGDAAFFPSDFGMSNVGDDGGNGGSDEIGEPEEIVIINDKIGKNGVETIIKKGDGDADYEVTGGAFAGLDVLLGGLFWRLVVSIGSHVIDG